MPRQQMHVLTLQSTADAMKPQLSSVLTPQMFLDVVGCAQSLATVWAVIRVDACVASFVIVEATLGGEGRSRTETAS